MPYKNMKYFRKAATNDKKHSKITEKQAHEIDAHILKTPQTENDAPIILTHHFLVSPNRFNLNSFSLQSGSSSADDCKRGKL